MSINCQIIEATKKEDYATMKQDYLNGVRGVNFMKKYNIGKSAYRRMLREFREDGVKISNQGRKPKNRHVPSYITIAHGFHNDKYIVQKVINKKNYQFGRYNTYEQAKARVIELKKNNWEDIIL